jgi:hypothetical protein
MARAEDRDSHVSLAWLGFSVTVIYCVQSRHAGQGARRTAGAEIDVAAHTTTTIVVTRQQRASSGYLDLK